LRRSGVVPGTARRWIILETQVEAKTIGRPSTAAILDQRRAAHIGSTSHNPRHFALVDLPARYRHTAEIIATVQARKTRMIPASTGLQIE
jgi:hypothetical protein